VDLLTSSAATGDAGNSWGSHKTRVVSTSTGDTYTVYQAPGSGYTAHQWVVMHYSAASGSWSQAGSGDAGREPANILRGPDDTIYVIAWPSGLPAMWTSTDNFGTQHNIPGNWVQNDWPYAGASMDAAGNIYLVQSDSVDLQPGHLYYAERYASTGQWSSVETANTDLRHTYSFPLPIGGLNIIASADVEWSTMGWNVPSSPMNSTYVWPQFSDFTASSATQSATETVLHSETQSSQYPNVNVYAQDAYVDNQGRVHVLYGLTGPSTQDQSVLHHALVQGGHVVKDVAVNMYDTSEARIAQDSTGAFYLITTDPTCKCMLVYPADSVDGTTLQGSYVSLPLNGYVAKDWLFIASPRTGTALSDELDFAFPADNAEQWVSGRLRLRDSGTPTPTVSASPTTTSLAAPTNLAGGFGNGAMGLTWNSVPGAVSYNVYRGLTNGTETLYQQGITNPSFSDTNLQAGIDYWYEITAVNASGESGFSNEIITYTPTSYAAPSSPPATPTNFTAAYSNGGIALSWNASAGATSYTILRGWISGSRAVSATSVNGTSYVDTNLQAGLTYWYTVTAVNAAGSSAPSQAIIASAPSSLALQTTGSLGAAVAGASPSPTATPSPTRTPSPTATPSMSIPNAPQNLHGGYSNGANRLAWTASSTPNVTYNLYRGWMPGTETLYKTGLTSTSYADRQGLQKGIDYWYKVTAVNSAGQSAASNEIITYVR